MPQWSRRFTLQQLWKMRLWETRTCHLSRERVDVQLQLKQQLLRLREGGVVGAEGGGAGGEGNSDRDMQLNEYRIWNME